MDEIRFAVVGLGHRGRYMFQLGCKAAEKIIPAAACDIDPDQWYKSQRNETPLAEQFAGTRFYEDFETILEREKIDVLLVETPAHLHAGFCAAGHAAFFQISKVNFQACTEYTSFVHHQKNSRYSSLPRSTIDG